jgi:hypothetical protein
MSITTTYAVQTPEGGAGRTADSALQIYPIDRHGKLRFIYGKVTQGAAAGDDGSFLYFAKLPKGRKRIVPYLCRYKLTALGAARVMKVGHGAYYDRSAVGAVATAAVDNAFMSAIDVSGATDALWPTTAGIKFDMFSRDEIWLYATITGGTVPAAAVAQFLVAYLYD